MIEIIRNNTHIDAIAIGDEKIGHHFAADRAERVCCTKSRTPAYETIC